MSPLRTACLDIFSPPPGAREVMTQVERLSSRDTKIALRSVRIAACSSGRGQRARMVAPEWVVQRFSTRTLPESKVLPIAPMGSPPSAAQRTPWPRPRQSRGLSAEARWSEGAAPPSRPCRTGTAAPELKRSDDRPHAPWFVSATPGPSVYPQPQPSGIPPDPFSRSPYDHFSDGVRSPGLQYEGDVGWHVLLADIAGGEHDLEIGPQMLRGFGQLDSTH